MQSRVASSSTERNRGDEVIIILFCNDEAKQTHLKAINARRIAVAGLLYGCRWAGGGKNVESRLFEGLKTENARD